MTEIPQQTRDGVRTESLRDWSTFRRSLTDRKIAGVAGGLGRHLDVDPTVLRVLLVVLCFFGGAGFVLYGAAWLLVPEEGSDRAIVRTSSGARTALLAIAAVVGALLLLGNGAGRWGFPWPLAVLALVLFLILKNRDKPMPEHGSPTPPAGGDLGGTATMSPPVDTTDAPPPAPPWTPPTQEAYQPPTPRPYRGPSLFGPTMALLAVTLGALGLYDVAGGHVVAPACAALALAVVGVMLVVGAWVGRAGALVLVGILAALALAVTSAAQGIQIDGGRRLAADPASAAAVQSRYAVTTGQVTLDLSGVRDPAKLDGRTIRVHANVGQIVVTLPHGVGADVHAVVSGPGAVDVPGAQRGGIDTQVSRDFVPAGETAHVNLDLDLAVGHIEVRQS